MKTGRPRTFDIRKEDLERLRAHGYGRIAISKVYGCHETTIRHWLVKYGLPTTNPLTKPSESRMQQLMRAAE